MSSDNTLSKQLYRLELRLDCYSGELLELMLDQLKERAKQLEYLAVSPVLYTRNKRLLIQDFAEYDVADGIPYASVTLTNSQGVVQYASYYSDFMPVNFDAVIRMAQAIAVVEQKGELCPANWHPGKRTVRADSWDVADYILKELLV
ncbi:hypothetical protein L2725_00950 [Shewanella corallii]|uniref:Peroxiredoxin C-terminal domain-containing protein n=1 Tax=Shewanella corallii TaxID=560080 RepID=A0ABT0N1Q9_9GAMM|nr:hypothetical protein [Shewanella corallii]MCL2912362.1 hypothetical protein [Shewanella corallii]